MSTRFEEGDGTIDRARLLRRIGTPAEERLWSVVRAGRLDGFKFRRQQRLGPFFGDFVCQSARLVVELDGESHIGEAAAQYDARRTAFLNAEGYRVIRFTNVDVMRNLEGTLFAIRGALVATPSPGRAMRVHPLPQGERER